MKKTVTKKAPAAKKACCCATKTASVKKACAAKKVALKNVTFTLHADKGKSVYVAGEFNEWNPSAKKMAYKASTSIYSAVVKMAPGG